MSFPIRGDNFVVVGVLDRSAWERMFDLLRVVVCRMCFRHLRTSTKEGDGYILCRRCAAELAREENPL